MAEEYTLDAPIVGKTTTGFKLAAMTFDREATGMVTPEEPTPAPGLVNLRLRDDAGNVFNAYYYGAEAMNLIRWVNTANFSTTSMNKRLMQKLEKDGKLPPGETTGTPDTSTPPVGMEE